MKRTSTLTLPYTFCLFCGAIAVVLLMAGTAAWMGYRDTRAAIPRQASEVLHDAIAPVTQALALHFDPPVAALGTLREWMGSGTLPEKSMQQWPALLLPVIAPIPAIRSIDIVKENGAYWRLDRSDTGWLGTLYDPAVDLDRTMLSAWDSAGIRESTPAAGQSATDPRLEAWYHDALALECTDEGDLKEVVSAQSSEGAVTVSSPLRFPDGRRGGVALILASPVPLAASALPRGVMIALDPGGARVEQIQDTQTIALLRERALPVTASKALSLLLPDQQGGVAEPWYAAEAYAFNDQYAWWVIGTVDAAQLSYPALPLARYLTWSLLVGAVSAIALALLLGRRITRPLKQVAARAQSIQIIDEHYVPWPKSRFTEVNVLTAALEDIYEAAVEHLDYHDAPLVVWGQPDAQDMQHTIDAEAVRHVINIPRAHGQDKSEEPAGPIINVPSGGGLLPTRDPAAAAQIQALHGTRKEVRRLQVQLAGAYEELRSTDSHFQADQARIKRQRKCLRGLDRILLSEGGASPTMLLQLQEILGASRVSVWISGRDSNAFHLRGVSGILAPNEASLTIPFSLVALLQTESVVTVQEAASDSRLQPLSAHAFFSDGNGLRLLAPIRFVGKLLGFIIAERPSTHRRWKGDEELFFISVAALCSGVVCQQLRQRTETKLTQEFPPRNGNGNGNGNGNTFNGRSLHARISIESTTLHWETDRAGCITAIDGDVEGLYGHSAEQLIGQPITFLSDTLEGRRDLDQLAALLSGARCRGYDTEHRAADGTLFSVHVRAKVRRDANDHVVGARGTVARVASKISH